jgi:hypothetical protein
MYENLGGVLFVHKSCHFCLWEDPAMSLYFTAFNATALVEESSDALLAKDCIWDMHCWRSLVGGVLVGLSTYASMAI